MLRRGVSLQRAAGLALALIALAGCQTTTKDRAAAEAAAVAAVEVPMDVRIQDARSHLAANDQATALSKLHEAARLHPGSAQPWSVIAQIQFDAGNYGAAIVAGQEVLARDAADTAANNIIAVSGLRSAVTAIAFLRRVDGIHGSARQESTLLADRLRESLGLPVLVPAPEQAQASKPPTTTRRSPRAAAPRAEPGQAPAAARAAPSRDPFGSLK